MMISKDIRQFIEDYKHLNTAQIVLKVKKELDVDPTFIINQINGLNKVVNKIPTWSGYEDLIYPSVVSMEQCSSELTAKYKASLVNGNLLDMTGGFGVDTYFFAQQCDIVHYCEMNKYLHDIVKYNLSTLSATNVSTYCVDGIKYLNSLSENLDWIYLDPARRTESKSKIITIEDSTPNILEIKDLLLAKAENVLVKFSPMLDINQVITKIKNVEKIYVVAVKNECKEILVHLNKDGDSLDIPLVCINLKSIEDSDLFVSTTSHRQHTPTLGKPLTYLYEPNKAILKAGLQNDLAHTFSLTKLHNNSHFYTSNNKCEDYPGRIFEILDTVKLKKKQIATLLPDHKANIIARNYPLKASEIYKRYGIIPGGESYIIATKLSDNSNTVLHCSRLK